MKKFLTILLVISLVLSFVACAETGNGDNTGDSAADSSSVATPDDSSAEPSGTSADSVKVMTHAEYVAAEDQTPVVIEGYIQNKQVYFITSIMSLPFNVLIISSLLSHFYSVKF